MSFLKHAWNSPTILSAAGLSSIYLAILPVYQMAEKEAYTHSCRSEFGEAEMGVDEKNGSFLVMADRQGRILYEANRMYLPNGRREMVNEFCKNGTAPPLKKEFVTASFPQDYQCEGLNGQKAAAFPASPDRTRIIRSHPTAKPFEIIYGKLPQGMWYAQQHCKGVQ